MPASEFCEPCARAPNDHLRRGITLFNQQDYFACHEVLEEAWNAERAPIRTLYKGILQVGVGCYHLLRHNYKGAMIKLQTGAEYLEPFAPVCMQLDLVRLIAEARRLRVAVEEAGPAGTATVDRALLPLIQMTHE